MMQTCVYELPDENECGAPATVIVDVTFYPQANDLDVKAALCAAHALEVL